MHTFTPQEIDAILTKLNESQTHPDRIADVALRVHKVSGRLPLPRVERIDEIVYLVLPETNLTLIATPANGRYHWSGMTNNGAIYDDSLVQTVRILLSENGKQRQFFIDRINCNQSVIWVDGRFGFTLDGVS